MSNLFAAAVQHYIQPQRLIVATINPVSASAIWP
jgi:hypothetical protein